MHCVEVGSLRARLHACCEGARAGQSAATDAAAAAYVYIASPTGDGCFFLFHAGVFCSFYRPRTLIRVLEIKYSMAMLSSVLTSHLK